MLGPGNNRFPNTKIILFSSKIATTYGQITNALNKHFSNPICKQNSKLHATPLQVTTSSLSYLKQLCILAINMNTIPEMWKLTSIISIPNISKSTSYKHILEKNILLNMTNTLQEH